MDAFFLLVLFISRPRKLIFIIYSEHKNSCLSSYRSGSRRVCRTCSCARVGATSSDGFSEPPLRPISMFDYMTIAGGGDVDADPRDRSVLGLNGFCPSRRDDILMRQQACLQDTASDYLYTSADVCLCRHLLPGDNIRTEAADLSSSETLLKSHYFSEAFNIC